MWWLLSYLFLLLTGVGTDAAWNGTNVTEVFLIPHVHADTGWMIKFEEYYEQVVRHILDSTIAALQVDPQRRFCWAEVAYIARWWDDQNATTKNIVRDLAQQKRIEFVEGGWSQSDEQVADLDERIENLMVGHTWLQHEIGAFAKPRHAWKLDPFGGSSLSPALFDALEWDSMTKMRVPWSLKNAAELAGKAEMVWRVDSDVHKADAAPEIFTHLLTSYSGLENQGFDFDQYRVKSPTITAANVAERAQVFASLATQWAGYFADSQTNQLQLPWGGDMRWQNASFYYGNMSVLIDYVNARRAQYGLSIRWATPSEYFDALHTATCQTNEVLAHRFPLLQGDPFTPYDSNMGSAAMKSFWTGIYDSETEEKRWTRHTMSTLRAATAAFVFAQTLSPPPSSSVQDPALEIAGRSVGIGVHHDAIPGTSNTGMYTGSDPIHGGFVVQDYTKRLQEGAAAAQASLERSLARIHGLEAGGSEFGSETGSDTNISLRWFGRGQVLSQLPASILIHNPYQGNVTTAHSMRIAKNRPNVDSASMIVVRDSYGKPILAQIESDSNNEFDELVFLASVPALGSAMYIIEAAAAAEAGSTQRTTAKKLTGAGTTNVHGGCVSIEVARGSGELVGVATLPTLDDAEGRGSPIVKAAVRSSFVAYTNTSSGSYAFIPDGAAVPVPTGAVRASLSIGPLRSVVTQEWPQSGLTKTVTLATHAEDTLCAGVGVHAGTRWAVANGTELVLRFESDIDNGDPPMVETDNGLAMVPWTYNSSCVTSCSHKDLLAGNYRAVLNRATITDLQLPSSHHQSHQPFGRRRLELVVDRAHGVASLKTGQIEVKLQRNVGADGDGPAANDTDPLIAPVQLLLGQVSGADSFAQIGAAAVRANVSDPLMTFTINRPGSNKTKLAPRSLLSAAFVEQLPRGVRLQSLRWLGSENSNVLVRFVNYYSRPIEIETETILQMLAPPLRLSDLRETTLTGTSLRKDAAARRLRWHTRGTHTTAEFSHQTGDIDEMTMESQAHLVPTENFTGLGSSAIRFRPLSVHTYSAKIERAKNA